MVTRSGHGRALITALVAIVIAVSAAQASAQSLISFSGGASIDPTQVYTGVAWESPDIAGRFRIRPGIDGGFGDGLRLGTIHLDLLVKFPLGGSGWALMQGGGPVISIAKYTGDLEDFPREVHAGGSYFLGFAHDSGFFTEMRLGGGNWVPQLKLGVGWTIEIR